MFSFSFLRECHYKGGENKTSHFSRHSSGGGSLLCKNFEEGKKKKKTIHIVMNMYTCRDTVTVCRWYIYIYIHTHIHTHADIGRRSLGQCRGFSLAWLERELCDVWCEDASLP